MNRDFNLYCDLDGVLADFPRGIKEEFGLEFPTTWLPQEEFDLFHDDLFDKIAGRGTHFWEQLFPMSDCHRLWDHIKQYNPSILTAYPSNVTDTWTKRTCSHGKRKWIRENLGIYGLDRFNICYSKDKHKFVDVYHPSILIDDRKTNIRDWIGAGGIGILHTSAVNSIYQLNEVLGNLYDFS